MGTLNEKTIDGKSLHGKVALVTGGSRGIGRGIVGALAAAGAEVWAVARDPGALAALKGEVEGVHAVAADVAEPESAPRLLRDARPDILVLNAGATPHMSPVHEQSWDQFSRVWNMDVKSTFHFGKEAVSMPLAPGSVVVIVSSGAAAGGSPVSGGYAGAKRMQWFLAQYLQDVSKSLNLGIRFVALLPKQFVGSTAIGDAAATAYAKRRGTTKQAVFDGLIESFGAPLTPEFCGQGVISLIADGTYGEGSAYGITAKGLELLD